MQKPREQQTDSSENRVKTKMAFSRVHASAKATLTHSLCLSVSLSFRFNGPFSRWTWVSWCLLKQRMVEVVVTIGATSRAKLQSNTINTKLFTGQMPFLSPSQQCQSTEGKNITFHALAYRKLTWGLPTLSLTTNSSWLPWGRVAMALIIISSSAKATDVTKLLVLNKCQQYI